MSDQRECLTSYRQNRKDRKGGLRKQSENEVKISYFVPRNTQFYRFVGSRKGPKEKSMIWVKVVLRGSTWLDTDGKAGPKGFED